MNNNKNKFKKEHDALPIPHQVGDLLYSHRYGLGWITDVSHTKRYYPEYHVEYFLDDMYRSILTPNDVDSRKRDLHERYPAT